MSRWGQWGEVDSRRIIRPTPDCVCLFRLPWRPHDITIYILATIVKLLARQDISPSRSGSRERTERNLTYAYGRKILNTTAGPTQMNYRMKQRPVIPAPYRFFLAQLILMKLALTCGFQCTALNIPFLREVSICRENWIELAIKVHVIK